MNVRTAVSFPIHNPGFLGLLIYLLSICTGTIASTEAAEIRTEVAQLKVGHDSGNNERAAAQLFAVEWSNTDSLALRIDSGTGDSVSVGLTGFRTVNSMARDGNGIFWAVGGGSLLTVDPATGEGTFQAFVSVGFTGSVRALAFSRNDELYAIVDSEIDDSLYVLDQDTGIGTQIGDTGFDRVQGLASSPTHELFGWDIEQGLLRVDQRTGLAENVNGLADGTVDIQTIAFLSDGTLFGAGNALYEIDPQLGSVAVIGTGDYDDIRGIEALEKCFIELRLGRQTVRPESDLGITVYLEHNRARAVTVPLFVWIEAHDGTIVAGQQTEPLDFELGDTVERRLALHIPAGLPPGVYRVAVGVEKMKQGLAWAVKPLRVVP